MKRSHSTFFSDTNNKNSDDNFSPLKKSKNPRYSGGID